jgi:glyoxylase-like metal-dependent hydrolase (beta-lactamase superfamily II)
MNRIERIKCGNGNCFLIYQDDNAILVDTCRTKYRKKILDICKNAGVKLIVLTHGHIDHISNAAFLSKELSVPIAMHKDDYELTKNNMLQKLYAHQIVGKIILAISIKSFQQEKIELFEPEVFLKNGDTLKNFGVDATIIELQGHTKGSIGIKTGNSDFIIGDALMNMFYPTTSMLYSDFQKMKESANYISGFGQMMIHFGHGKSVPNRKW